MAYRIERGEPLPDALRRVFVEQVEEAARLLAQAPQGIHAAIHDARRAMRRARAAQALLRAGLDAEQWAACSATLREAGSRLSPLRDAQSMVEAIEGHLQEAGIELDEAARARLLRSLRARRERIVAAGAPALRAARAALGRAAGEAASLFAGFDERALARGLASARRRLDRAFEDVRLAPHDADALHRLRQRARVHWLQLELVAAAWPAVLGAQAAEAKRLSQSLGDERDLQLLDGWLAQRRAPLPGGRALPVVREDIAGLRARLRARAFRLAARIGAEPPGRFARRVRSLRAASGN
ncbi:MAG: CHAD domain-containing protein [Xanthomonadaceae bacterium]|nr:CHAD domain-containing protein [Xanthomonadaceae bacterium]